MTIRSLRLAQRPSLGWTQPIRVVIATCILLVCFGHRDAVAQRMKFGSEDYGVRGRVGYVGGETVGRTESLTHLELMPYLRTPTGILMSDLRFFTSDGEVGANVGLGYREFMPEISRVFGGIVWYDFDQLSGDDTQQITLSLETYGETFDALANIYVPIGDEQIGSLRSSNERFVGDRLLYDQSGTLGDVMGGGDVQIGALLPGQFAAENQVRAFAGLYHYTGTSADDINGFIARLEGTFLDMIDSQVKLTSDDTTGTNVLFGISIGMNRGMRGTDWRSQSQDQLTRYPTRQYNAVVVNTAVSRMGVAAANPETGDAYTFTHIASGAAGAMDGSAENPFDSLLAGMAQDTDYHIVHGDSVFVGADAAIALADGNRLIGNSASFQHELEAKGVGSIMMPTMNAGSDAPILRGSAGDTIVMASNSELRGFTIDQSGRNGVVLDGTDNAIVSNVSVLDAARNGFLVRDISGSVSILDSSVDTSGVAALRIDDITGSVLVTGDFKNDSGEALILQDIGDDANIDLTGATFSNDTGSGLAFNQVGGTVSLSGVSLVDSSGNGINIDGGTGTIRFRGETVIEGASGDAVRMHNSDAKVEFEALTIRNASGAAISVFNNTNTASFNVIGHTTIDGATDGIRVQDNQGSVDFNSVEIDGRMNHGIVIDNTEGQFVINETLAIANSSGSTDSAIEISGSAADVIFVGKADIIDATGDAAISLSENTGITAFGNVDVAAQDGAGVVAANAGTLRIVNGNVATENAAAFDINGAATDIQITSVSVSGGDYGIRLKDTTGEFVINGTDDGAGTGGAITGTTTGILLENAGVVGVRYMTFDNTVTGISADDVDRLSFWDGSIRNSQVATNLLNVSTLEFVRSEFSDNDSYFNWMATTAEGHDWLLNGVTVDAGSQQALTAQGTGDADLSVTIQASNFASIGSNLNLLDVSSNGRLDLAMSGNQFQSSGNNATLLDITTTSTTDLGRFTLFNNLFSPTGSSVTAINTTTGGPSEILFEQNTIEFAADRGIGMAFNLAGSATVGLYTNLITDGFDGATAVLFENVAGPSRIEIVGNALDFANLGGLSDRGFIFETISGDVNLLGDVDNIVSGASLPVFVPSGRTTGSFLINGIRVP